MATTTSRTTFKVPGLATSDGILVIWPHFHRSAVFTAGGYYDWSICYYPDSLYDSDSIDLCLQLESRGTEVTISSSVSLLDPKATLPPLNLVKPSPPLRFDSEDEDRRMVTHWVPKRVLREALRHGYLQGQSGLLFQWTITVIYVPEPELMIPVPELMPMPMLEPELTPVQEPRPEVPTADVVPEPMSDVPDVAPLSMVPATDVTYSVWGLLFHAHKAILAAQSPVFKAELSEAMKKKQAIGAPAAIIKVDGMRPDVFEALLSYIYTDALPDTEGQSDEDDDATQMMCDLLVAADRYDLERLKLLCERELSKIVDVENVAKMLAFADDHYCCALQDACIEFMVTSGRMEEVVETPGYQLLRRKHPLILVDVLEKFLIFHNVY
ncbi:hypothetical protein SEVIR_6G016600v4 [Setaria viridis]|uniref:BTB domain-containing protein n=1 Tax=Setaria viridis TaxID=4556 RepID=A0A4U6UCX8_SETVI|nr:BTB/POZ and MATH domain-containing protein 2-like [Setaria viridis]TKW08247.1 hypothetical protein SEVIR_6G016600v2 [Setaria viridis]